jgi:hypothetical protein
MANAGGLAAAGGLGPLELQPGAEAAPLGSQRPPAVTGSSRTHQQTRPSVARSIRLRPPRRTTAHWPRHTNGGQTWQRDESMWADATEVRGSWHGGKGQPDLGHGQFGRPRGRGRIGRGTHCRARSGELTGHQGQGPGSGPQPGAAYGAHAKATLGPATSTAGQRGTHFKGVTESTGHVRGRTPGVDLRPTRRNWRSAGASWAGGRGTPGRHLGRAAYGAYGLQGDATKAGVGATRRGRPGARSSYLRPPRRTTAHWARHKYGG